VWRLVSWLLIPPNSLTSSALDILTIIMLFVYYQLGSLLENVWGDFLYNVYIFTGLVMTVVGAFLLYAITGQDYGVLFSTYYVSLSIFLGFAMTFPDQQMLFMFIIPIRIKYLAVVDIIYLIYSVFQAARYGLWLPVLVMILSSLAGTILFFFGTRHFSGLKDRQRQKVLRKQMQGGRTVYTWQQQNRNRGNSRTGGTGTNSGSNPFGTNNPNSGRNPYDSNGTNNGQDPYGTNGTNNGQNPYGTNNGQDPYGTNNGQNPYGTNGTNNGQNPYGTNGRSFGSNSRVSFSPKKDGRPIHRCAVCGRTELDDPELEFRFCSKCNGNYEYCNDHLFTHIHVK